MNQSNQFYILIFYSSINLSIFYTSSVHPINQYLTVQSINMRVATLNMIYYLHWRIYSAFFGLQYISTPHCSHCRICQYSSGCSTSWRSGWWVRYSTSRWLMKQRLFWTGTRSIYCSTYRTYVIISEPRCHYLWNLGSLRGVYFFEKSFLHF